VIKDLKAKPKKEEVMVAERALDVAKKRAQYSGERVPRMERLYKDRAISFEEYDSARRDAEVEADEVAKRAADLAWSRPAPRRTRSRPRRPSSIR
jgi:putative peptide zinc metalloprotease protein